MATVRRVITLIDETVVDDGDGFNPQVAVGLARAQKTWERRTEQAIYEVTEDDNVYQLSGRVPFEELK